VSETVPRELSLDAEGFRRAFADKLGKPVDDDRWRQVLEHLHSLESHDPYDDGDLEDALRFWRQGDRELEEAAERLRLRLTGHQSVGFLRTLVAEAGAVSLDYAIWVRTGRIPQERHGDEVTPQSLPRLLERTGLMSLLSQLTLAVQILADQQRVSIHRAYCALMGVSPSHREVVHRSFFADEVLGSAVDASAFAVKTARSRSRRVGRAVASIRAAKPRARWLELWGIYQSDWVPLGYPDYVNRFEAFKKAATRASKQHGQ